MKLIHTEHLFGFATLAFVSVIMAYLAAKAPRVRDPLIVGFLIRAVLSLVQVFLFRLPGSGADAIRFEAVGWSRAQEGFLATFNHFKLGSGAYYWLISVVYSLVGRSPLTVLGINVLLGSLTIWVAYRCASLLWDKKAGRRAAWMVALFPTLALNSAIMLREAPVIFFFYLGVYQMVKWFHSGRVAQMWMGMFWVGLSASFHEGMFIALPIFGLAALWKSLKTLLAKGPKSPARLIFVVCSVVLLAGVIFGTGWGLSFTQAYFDRADVETLSQRQEVAARSRAAYPSSLTVNGPRDILTKGPIRILYFLFAPFPWMLRTLDDVMGLFDSLLYAFIAFLIWRGRHTIRDQGGVQMILMILLAMLIVFSLAVGNYGTAVRHRGKLVVLPIMVAAGVSWPRLTVVKRKNPENRSQLI